MLLFVSVFRLQLLSALLWAKLKYCFEIQPDEDAHVLPVVCGIWKFVKTFDNEVEEFVLK